MDRKVIPTKQLSREELITHYEKMCERYRQNARDKIPYTIASDEKLSVSLWNDAADHLQEVINRLRTT